MPKKNQAKPAARRRSNELPGGDEIADGEEMKNGIELDDGVEMDSGIEMRRAREFVRRPASGLAAAAPFSGASGEQVLEIARLHLGEAYVLGARAPMANAAWKGPWDCAEFASWCVYRASGLLFGTEPRNDPMLADAYTGYWFEQAVAAGCRIDWREAAHIAGAAVLRRPLDGQRGHIVFSDGSGGTIEAHSNARGVIAGPLRDRRWDCGILVPGIRYLRSDTPVDAGDTVATLRLTQPLTRGERALAIQRRLQALGFFPGDLDGIYGPQTAHAVRAFQARQGLVVDGEVGRLTLAALGID